MFFHVIFICCCCCFFSFFFSILLVTLSQCQTVWIQIRTDTLSLLIWALTFCKAIGRRQKSPPTWKELNPSVSLFSRNFNSNMSYSSCRKLGDAKKKNQEKRAKISMQFLWSQISFKGGPRETRENTYWRETISLRSVRKTFPNKTSPDFSHDGAHEIVHGRF